MWAALVGLVRPDSTCTAALLTWIAQDHTRQLYDSCGCLLACCGSQYGRMRCTCLLAAAALLLAGEATHTSVNPCVQAALETGERAARQVIATLNQPASKL